MSDSGRQRRKGSPLWARPFGDFRSEARQWIRVFGTGFYPDSLGAAVVMYAPVIERFAELTAEADDSAELLRTIQREPKEVRGQLLRVFRKYVSPASTPVEMLKVKSRTEQVIEDFGEDFRDVAEVRAGLHGRPSPDEALIAVLDEYRERGKKGYELTEAFFVWFEAEFAERGWTIEGPLRAGRDVDLARVIDGYPTKTPVDFIVRDSHGVARVVGFARYDSDRGGAQEDDRVGGNERRLREILRFKRRDGPSLRVVFLNDGPGLLLGSMWADYAAIEHGGKGRALVMTLAMAQAGRFSLSWIESLST